MALAEDNFDEIKKRVFVAYKIEEPVLQEFREFAKRLKNDVKPIRPFSVNAVSFVSSDGGDNRLYFNPATVELVRVVDSLGNQCALDAIASNSKASELNTRVETASPLLVEPLRKLCQDLNTNVVGLSYLLKGLGEPGKSTGAVRIYRDIVEWAVLYDLMKYRVWGSDTIIVREGMLRTKSFKRKIFPQFDQLIRGAYQDHKKKNITVSMVGVAKQSAVLSRLSVALELEETLHKPYPCYVRVPDDIEAKCYNFDRTWLDTLESGPNEEGEYLYQAMGKLFLVKFGNRPFDPVWPVDIAEWQLSEVDKIIGQLTRDAQPGFPIPDFPMCVQRAHDFAKVNGLEVDILQDILFEGITQNLTPEEKEKVFRMKYLGQNLTNIRYRNA